MIQFHLRRSCDVPPSFLVVRSPELIPAPDQSHLTPEDGDFGDSFGAETHVWGVQCDVCFRPQDLLLLSNRQGVVCLIFAKRKLHTGRLLACK